MTEGQIVPDTDRPMREKTDIGLRWEREAPDTPVIPLEPLEAAEYYAMGVEPESGSIDYMVENDRIIAALACRVDGIRIEVRVGATTVERVDQLLKSALIAAIGDQRRLM